jgi:predicted O-linked N-acetylglucosamine transferase (SPINDLY family)
MTSPSVVAPETLPAAFPTAHRAAHRHWSLGIELAGRAEWGAAVRAFSRAAEAAPGDALYWINLANAHRHTGNTEQAISAARRCLKLDANQPLALRLLGDGLAQLHLYEDAVAAFEKLEESGAQEIDALVQHGAMLQALRRHVQAIAKLMQAATLQPDCVQAHALMATSFRDMALQNEAVECLKTVLALDPHNLQAQSHLSYERRHVCDWDTLDADVAQLSATLANAPRGLARVATVFGLLSLPIAPELLLTAAQGEALAATLGVTPLPPAQRALRPMPMPMPKADARARVGMLSFDFHEHPVSQLLVEVLEGLDRRQFELVLYSSGRDDGSALRQRVIHAADRFIDVRGLSDRQAAQRMRNDGIDILIDLQGHTRGHRLPILAHRPAPVQVAFLGYPGTTGAPFIDYLIGDPFVTPLDLAPLYSEKLAQMPLSFQPNGRWRPLPAPMARAAAGLPEGAFVMCAFNHTYKILPQAFDAWCEVLREVPRAVLWLKETNAQLHDNVLREAAARGVEPQRIVFAKAVSYAEHFSRLALADVFCDTWPYNAHTTASDALWAGVPVLTVYQNSFASRVAASVLNAVGLAELAFESVADYTQAIIALASDAELLAGYRRHLTEQRMTLPLFDSARYTRGFEALLRRMFERSRRRQPPEHLPAASY